jgi:hypothetical protein
VQMTWMLARRSRRSSQRRMNTNLLVSQLNVSPCEGYAFNRSQNTLRLTCTAILCAALWISLAQAHGAELKTIAILDFDLVDDQP